MFHSRRNSATSPLSSPKCAKYKTSYSVHPENKGDEHPKNLQYETCKKIYLPRISIKNNIKLSKRDNSEAGKS